MKNIPSSIYRIQFSPELPIKKVTQLIPYFSKMGIEGIYCSPIFESFSCGYDITNPNQLNPILGSDEEFEMFFSQLQKHEMKCILDVVPNHMSIKGNKNIWWNNVLEHGPNSTYAKFFDINWNPEKKELQNKILLPVLNQSYGEALENGEIQLFWDQGFKARYRDYIFPVQASITIQELASINSNIQQLHEILEKQYYRLSYWAVAGQEINYRRFFNINDLVAIHIEKEPVFKAYHQRIFQLIDSGKVQGLRIDHPDGLYDPSQYFEKIRQKSPGILWVEKILDFKENLPEKWDVDGTVGYDFLNLLSGLFIQKKNEQKLTEIYNQFIGGISDFTKINYERRKRYIILHMASEINFLGSLLDKLSEKSLYYRDFTQIDLTNACMEIMACFPVYRTYIKPDIEIRKKDQEYIQQAVESAKLKDQSIDSTVFDYIKKILLLEIEPSGVDFVLRFQQLTAPIMAKGLEDSTFYIYNRLISLNEVGGNPHYFGYSKEEFHAFNQLKLKKWPLGLLATSTHDSKYSEDARLRIHVISELPKEWNLVLTSLEKINRKYKTRQIPDKNTEYFIYQMTLALWPTTTKRLWVCLNKAIREAGLYTSWKSINIDYEKAVKKFFLASMKPNKQFLQFQKKVAEYGFWNSLSALILKICSCGIPDIYQGSELINLALVDPDNRHPVDFDKRKKALKQMKDLKLFVTTKGLNLRRDHKDLFLKGNYIPLKSPDNVIAFSRELDEKKIIIIVRRFFSDNKKIHGTINISNKKQFQDIFTGVSFQDKIDLSKAFNKYPFAVLTNL